MLSLERLTVAFGKSAPVLEGVSWEIKQGEGLALVGESGSGKSLSAYAVLGLLPTEASIVGGKILFGPTQQNLVGLANKEWRKIRGKQIGMVFQEPQSALNPLIRCGKQVQETLEAHFSIGAKEAKKRTLEWLDRVGLADVERMYTSFPHQLSGGQKQRVVIAQALIAEPAVLLADEPTTALDVTVQQEIIALLHELKREKGLTLLFITHSLPLVKGLCERIAVMKSGKIVEIGDTEQILSIPQDPYTQHLLASIPPVDVKVARLGVDNILANSEQQDVPINDLSTHKSLDINMRQISVSFPRKSGLFAQKTENQVLHEVSLSLQAGEVVALIGESGSGKTTLGRALLGLIPQMKGEVEVNGEVVDAHKAQSLRELWQKVQVVYQDPYASLNPWLTVYQTLVEAGYAVLKKEGKLSKSDKQAFVDELLMKVHLDPTLAARYPDQLSGGQRQRVGIARALAVKPAFLVLDESVSALDVSIQAQILNLFDDLRKEQGLGYLFITHDFAVVRFLADRVAVMEKGRLVELGSTHQVMDAPQHAYTQRLLAAVPRL